jgi:hypothetical protein
VHEEHGPAPGAPTPTGPEGPVGVGRSRRRGAARWLTHPLAWLALIGTLWGLPLLKSLRATYPEPPPGHERTPESFVLTDSEGRELRRADLEGFLLVVQPLDLREAEEAQAAFERFRARKKRLRGLSSLVHHVLLVDGASPETLGTFLDERTARKPSNLFLLDPGGEVWAALAGEAAPGATHLVLDRRGRLRGGFDDSAGGEADLNRLLTLLANWEGCDPPVGEPVRE